MNIVQGILFTNLDQLRVFFDAQHLIEELEGRVLRFGFLESLIFHLFFVLGCTTSLHALRRYKSLLPNHFVNLFFRHELGPLLKVLAASSFLLRSEPGSVGMTQSYSTADDNVNVLCRIAKVRQPCPRTHLHQFALLHHRCEVDGFKFCVGFEKRHAAHVTFNQFGVGVVTGTRLRIERLQQLELLWVRLLLKEMSTAYNFTAHQIHVQIPDPVIAPL